MSGGRYQNASEVLREGLRMIERRESEDKLRLKILREAARVGVADADAGRFTHFVSAQDLRRHLASVTEAAIGAVERGSASE